MKIIHNREMPIFEQMVIVIFYKLRIFTTDSINNTQGDRMKNLKILAAINYSTLILMNIMFYFVFRGRQAAHIYDVIGITSFLVVIVTFVPLHKKSGIWKLTHTKSEKLDERELALTHRALSESYGWFAIICLLILLALSLISRMNICPQYTISMPLVASMIYLAHTLPGTLIIWKNGLTEKTE